MVVSHSQKTLIANLSSVGRRRYRWRRSASIWGMEHDGPVKRTVICQLDQDRSGMEEKNKQPTWPEVDFVLASDPSLDLT